ncbi:hypothetical protein HYPDE_29968 [Hyphomicrobium denitrificans 1NES1]|uniref:Uncharacterized protein n=1 Tax=Hyphomicrobium denitrificans 1NES1 TaxID=670307 RepID=N0B3V5_9HYPH|nr:hypothetical protein HYPDE_29968 [Hyphomicrobium denitrificans 1NES1]
MAHLRYFGMQLTRYAQEPTYLLSRYMTAQGAYKFLAKFPGSISFGHRARALGMLFQLYPSENGKRVGAGFPAPTPNP